MKWNIYKLITTMFMIVGGIIFLIPFIWMLSASLKPEAEVFSYPIQWIPSVFMWENYTAVWTGEFLLAYWNSIKVTVITTVIAVTFSSMAAYGFSKIQFKGRDILFLLILATFMIPAQAILVPQFIIYQYLNLFDTHMGLILLNSFSVFGTFLLRQFYISIPDDYIHSAKIDGAGHFTIFTRIITPMVLPGIATYAILVFIFTWNDYQGPLILLRSDNL